MNCKNRINRHDCHESFETQIKNELLNAFCLGKLHNVWCISLLIVVAAAAAAKVNEQTNDK